MAAGTVARAFIGIDLGHMALRLALCARETHLHGALLRWSGPTANRYSGSPGPERVNRALQQNTDVLGAHTAVRRHPTGGSQGQLYWLHRANATRRL